MIDKNLHLESLSNGLGEQSMLLFLMMCRGEIPATVSVTSDTGWEADRTWSNGRRGPIKDYFEEIVIPMAEKHGKKAVFVRSVDVNKQPLPDLIDSVRKAAATGTCKGLRIPMFGSKGGRLRQSCTDKWKIRAINQFARSLGAKTSCSAQGIHMGEASRRVKGTFLRMDGKWSIYQNTVMVKTIQPDGTKLKVEKAVKWLTHYYPQECLATHDQSLGRTTRKNKSSAERMESDLRQMSLAHAALRLLPNDEPSQPASTT